MQPEIPNLTGKLLLAHPHLRDPNFRRSIVYLAKHDPATGAFGFIINRPTPQTLQALEVGHFSPLLAATKLYLGGPVGGENIILAMLDWDPFLQQMRIDYTTDPEEAEPTHTIALVGYSGWSPGQLEREIHENSWLILDPSQTGGTLLDADASTWKNLLADIHPNLRLLAEMPDDPSLN